MNTKLMVSSNTDMWATPQAFFDKLDSEFHFDLDPCATAENAKCKKFFTAEENGLLQSWKGHVVFCNPPYCRQTGFWVKKAYSEWVNHGVTVVMLLPSRPDVKWFHEFVNGIASEVRFVKGRLKFGDSKNSAPFPSMVVVYR